MENVLSRIYGRIAVESCRPKSATLLCSQNVHSGVCMVISVLERRANGSALFRTDRPLRVKRLHLNSTNTGLNELGAHENQ